MLCGSLMILQDIIAGVRCARRSSLVLLLVFKVQQPLTAKETLTHVDTAVLPIVPVAPIHVPMVEVMFLLLHSSSKPSATRVIAVVFVIAANATGITMCIATVNSLRRCCVRL